MVPGPLRGGAMARLGRALVALDSHRMPVHISTATRLMLEGLRDGLPEAPLREQVGRLLDPAQTDSALDQLGEVGWMLDPLLHNNVNATMVRGGIKINVIPSEIELDLDCRLLPGETAEITVTSKASLADLRKSMQVISLVDAIVPGSGNRTATTTASRR